MLNNSYADFYMLGDLYTLIKFINNIYALTQKKSKNYSKSKKKKKKIVLGNKLLVQLVN